MTVAELITQLQTHDPAMPVLLGIERKIYKTDQGSVVVVEKVTDMAPLTSLKVMSSAS